MAKKISRTMTASDDVAAIVDRGGEVDVQMKNLSTEDKGIKKRIADEVERGLQDGELSLRLEGKKAVAAVSVVEKYELNASADRFEDADKAIRAGQFGDVVKVVKVLNIPPAKVEAAFAVLKQMGMTDVLLETCYDINPEEFRVLSGSMASSPEKQAAIDALKSCVVRKATFRVGYEKK
jgi:hypothetical protein